MHTLPHGQNAVLDVAQVLIEADLLHSPRFYVLRERLQSFANRTGTQLPRLVTTLINTDAQLDGDLGALISGAIAEQADPAAYGAVSRPVCEALGAEILSELTTHAAAMYGQARERFNDLADEAVAVWKIIAPDTDPAQLLSRKVSDEDRAAFQAGQLAGMTLDAALPPLVAAARLVPGAAELVMPFNGEAGGPIARRPDPRAVFDLVLDVPATPAIQAQAVEAWSSTSTAAGGKWWKLHQLGCAISAIDDPAEVVRFAPNPVPAVVAPIEPRRDAPQKATMRRMGVIPPGNVGEFDGALITETVR